MNAENAPKNAIIELNSGTRIENMTENKVTPILWKTSGLKNFLTKDCPEGLSEPIASFGEKNDVSKPSMVAFSFRQLMSYVSLGWRAMEHTGCVANANFDLRGVQYISTRSL
jgi:hypothetical protein